MEHSKEMPKEMLSKKMMEKKEMSFMVKKMEDIGKEHVKMQSEMESKMK